MIHTQQKSKRGIREKMHASFICKEWARHKSKNRPGNEVVKSPRRDLKTIKVRIGVQSSGPVRVHKKLTDMHRPDIKIMDMGIPVQIRI